MSAQQYYGSLEATLCEADASMSDAGAKKEEGACVSRSRSRHAMTLVQCRGCTGSIPKDAKFCSECGAANAAIKFRRKAESALGADAQAIIQAINLNTDNTIGKLKEELKADITTMIDSKVAEALEPISRRLEKLEKNASKRASSAPPSEWTPTYLDIKGFVDKFEEAAEMGVTRDEAKALLASIKEAMPPDLQQSMGDTELRHERNFSIRIPALTDIRQLQTKVKKYLAQNNWKGRDLFVTLEKSPDDKRRYEAMGKIKRMLEKETATKLTDYVVRIFWGQDMSAFLEGPSNTEFIAHVAEDGGIQWDAEGLRLLGCANEKAVRLKLLAASRRFR